METLAIIGPIDAIGKQYIREKLGGRLNVVEIASADQYGMLKEVNYAVLRTLKLGRADIEAAPKLKLIQRWGVGYDSVDVQAASERGVQVAITTGINAIPVSEFAILLMLAVYRNLEKLDQNVRSGQWRDEGLTGRSYVLNGKTVGLVGLGNIGKLVAQKVQAFGASVAYYDLFRLPREDEEAMGLRFLPLEELLSTADVVSLHLPLTDDTRGIIGAAELARMKKTAILINTARGGIVKDDELYRALSENRILGAGLDVFSTEPPAKECPLLTLDNVVLSSHNAGNTADNSVYMAQRCVENIETVMDGKRIETADLVNGRQLKERTE